MKFGARNRIVAKVTSIQKGDVMSLVKFEVAEPSKMASVLTTESAEDLVLKVGDAHRCAAIVVGRVPDPKLRLQRFPRGLLRLDMGFADDLAGFRTISFDVSETGLDPAVKQTAAAAAPDGRRRPARPQDGARLFQLRSNAMFGA